MSNIIDETELAGLRRDFNLLLGIDEFPLGVEDISKARTLVTISEILDKGTYNETTHKWENPNTDIIYAGPGHISPIVFRRDRQEIGGGGAIRIRQYRLVVPWDTVGIEIDMTLFINFSDDPDMADRTWLVSDVMYESEIAARRITLTDITGDENC